MTKMSAKYIVGIILLASFAAGEIKNKGWWKNTIFYQIYPRSFLDSNNDGVGDLKGITSKLEHFVNAGIGAVWLSPIFQSPMVDFGYDISDFKAIHKEFGTMADFEALTKRAKELNIKVILDLVPNHTSDKHVWFQNALAGDQKYRDYYVWKAGTSNKPPNNWISVFSNSAWTCNDPTKQCYFHQFEYRQPDLNYTNPEVQKEMESVILFWLAKGVDGFRVDAVPHLYEDAKFRDEPRSSDTTATPADYTYLEHIYTKDDPRTYELVKSWRKVLDDYADQNDDDEKVMMTEAYTDLKNTTKYYKFGSHIPFNFKFITDVDNESKPNDFKGVIDSWMKEVPEGEVANWVMGNHDRSRTASRYPGRGDQMTMLAMILPGVAVTYYGEEIGMLDKTDISWEDTQDPQACNAGKDKYQSRSRDPNRTPFQWDNTTNAGFNNGAKPWIPVNSNYKELNLKNQQEDAISHFKVYQTLSNLKATSPVLQHGSYEVVVFNSTDVLGVIREYEGDCIVLLINFNDAKNETVSLNNHVGNCKSFKVETASVDSPVQAGTEVDLQVTVPKKAALVLSSSGAASLKALIMISVPLTALSRLIL